MRPSSKPAASALLIVAGIGLILRITLMIYADGKPAFDFPDSHRYVRVARNIAAGLGPIDSPEVRAGTDPMYPLLLSAVSVVGGNTDLQFYRWGRMINAASGVLSILLLTAIGSKLFSPRIGLIASAIFAIDPITLFFSSLVLTETVFTTLLLSSIWFLVLLPDSQTPGRSLLPGIAAGAILGIATLTRSSALFLAIPFAVFLAIAPKQRRRALAPSLFILAFILALSPTLVRNYHLFGAIVPVRTGNGASLMEALGPWADGGPGMNRIKYPPFSPDENELQRDKRCRVEALAWAADHPAKTASLALVKLARTWSITLNAADYSSPRYNLISALSVTPVYLLALLGTWFARTRPWSLLLLLTPAVYFSFIHMVFVGSIRYRIPATPLIFLLASITIAAIIDKSASAKSKRESPL